MKRGKEEKRPWGNFKTLALNEKCSVKILEIKKNEELSLQKHKKRIELWYPLCKGKVQIGNKIINVKEGDLIKIGKKVKHRAFGGKNGLKILEVSLGKFDEKDEIRLEDKYGRR